MATIEPRLIHLLNNDPQTPNLRPLNRVPFDVPSAVSLPPIEPDISYRSDHPTTTTHRPLLHAVGDDLLTKPAARSAENATISEPSGRVVKSAPSLQQLLGDREPSHSSSSLPLRMLVDDPVDPLDDPSTKKRHRGVSQKDDFMQLPQPLKKQKSTQQVVPPIIAGLHEPPPNPGVFPPIHSEPDELGLFGGDFPNVDEDRCAMALGANASDSGEKSNSGDKATETAKGKRRVAKPRRKWSDEETNNLLLGVSRYGVGKWTSILEDNDFKFNDRTAGDLKDRFRTCCPDEFLGLVLSAAKARRSGKSGSNGRGAMECVPAAQLSKFYHNSGLPKASKTKSPFDELPSEPESVAMTMPATSAAASDTTATVATAAEQVADQLPRQRTERELLHPSSVDSDSAPGSLGRQRKSRAHRKKLEDLAELGIHAPFKKSHRRERRPFTEQDDKEILEGLDYYGPAWTKIQRDKRFHLMSRQPTDLRDRVRNKYPDIYSKIEKGSFHAKNKRRGGRKDGETGEDGEGEGEGSQHRDEENHGGNQASGSDGAGDKANGEADGNIDTRLPLRSSERLRVRGEVAGGQLLEPAVSTTIERALQQQGPGQDQTWSNATDQPMAMPGVKVQRLIPLAPYPVQEPRLADTSDTTAERWKGKVPMGLGIAGVNGIAITENAFLSPSEMDISRLLLDDPSGSSVKRMAEEHHYPSSHSQAPYRQQHASQHPVPPPPQPPQSQSHHVRYGESPSPALGRYDYGPGRRA